MPLPDAIDHHACGERIPLIGNPSRKRLPAVGLRRILWQNKHGWKRTDRTNGSWDHFILGGIDIPPGEEKGLLSSPRCNRINPLGHCVISM